MGFNENPINLMGFNENELLVLPLNWWAGRNSKLIEMGILEWNNVWSIQPPTKTTGKILPSLCIVKGITRDSILILENLWFLLLVSKIRQWEIQQLRRTPDFNEDNRIPRVAETKGQHLTAKDKMNMFAIKDSRDMQVFTMAFRDLWQWYSVSRNETDGRPTRIQFKPRNRKNPSSDNQKPNVSQRNAKSWPFTHSP